MDVCKAKDDFAKEFAIHNPSWTVTLNNGEIIYQDDYRPGLQITSAWERLWHYCNKNNLYIVDMTIGFRSNKYKLPSNKDGYYFSKGARGAFGSTVTTHLFFVGYLEDGIINIEKWRVPEMLKESISDQRYPEKAGICLIKK